MNVYFYDPCFLKVERFTILVEILKVKRIIDLTEPITRNPELLSLYSSDTIFIRQDSEIETATRYAVYKFIEPMCKARVINSRLTGEFIINDLYKESNAYNPIYNLEKCNDENVLILFNLKDKIPLLFTKFSLNILQKHAEKFCYYNRICFNFIGLFFEDCSTFYKQKFYKLRRSITTLPYSYNNDFKAYKSYNYSKTERSDSDYDIIENFKENAYSPLLSYLYMKCKKLYCKNENNMALTDIFLNDEGKKQLTNIMNKVFKSKIRRHNLRIYNEESLYDDYKESEIEAWGADTELKYIRSNGGDWIDD